MIDHLELQTRNLYPVIAFYERVLSPLGYVRAVDGKTKGFGSAFGLDLFILEGEPSAHVHYAFQAPSRAVVHACFDLGCNSTGTQARAPALAPSVHPNYFAAYLRDPDGRLVEFVCHAQEPFDPCYDLYFAPGAASMCVHQALLELNVRFRLVHVDLAARQQRDDSYLRLNPNGVVPTLLIDGLPYFETAAILMTLATRHPLSGLAPPENSPVRARWHQWMVSLVNGLQPAFRLWFYPSDLTDDPTITTQLKGGLRRKIESEWTKTDAHLALHGPYLLGNVFSCADLLLMMLLRWSRDMPKPGTRWPALREFVSLMTARASWKQLCAEEGLSVWPSD